MARILKPNRFNLGLFDSDTNKSLKVTKAVDITAHCKMSERDRKDRAILLFSRAKRGRLVQIMVPYPGKTYGIQIHFFVDELDEQMNVGARDDTFGSWAKRFGFKDKPQFQRLIRRYAPGRK